MQFGNLNNNAVQPVQFSEGLNVSNNREPYNPGSITYAGDIPAQDLQTKKDKKEGKKSSARHVPEEEITDLFQLTDHPAFPFLLTSFFSNFDKRAEEIRRMIREQRGVNDNLPYPRFSMSYLLYQSKRIEFYLQTLMKFADQSGQKFRGFI